MEIKAYSLSKKNIALIYKLEHEPYEWCWLTLSKYKWVQCSKINKSELPEGLFRLFILDDECPFYTFQLYKYGYYYSIIYEIIFIILSPFIFLLSGLILNGQLVKILVGRFTRWVSKIFGFHTIKKVEHT